MNGLTKTDDRAIISIDFLEKDLLNLSSQKHNKIEGAEQNHEAYLDQANYKSNENDNDGLSHEQLNYSNQEQNELTFDDQDRSKEEKDSKSPSKRFSHQVYSKISTKNLKKSFKRKHTFKIKKQGHQSTTKNVVQKLSNLPFQEVFKNAMTNLLENAINDDDEDDEQNKLKKIDKNQQSNSQLNYNEMLEKDSERNNSLSEQQQHQLSMETTPFNLNSSEKVNNLEKQFFPSKQQSKSRLLKDFQTPVLNQDLELVTESKDEQILKLDDDGDKMSDIMNHQENIWKQSSQIPQFPLKQQKSALFLSLNQRKQSYRAKKNQITPVESNEEQSFNEILTQKVNNYLSKRMNRVTVATTAIPQSIITADQIINQTVSSPHSNIKQDKQYQQINTKSFTANITPKCNQQQFFQKAELKTSFAQYKEIVKGGKDAGGVQTPSLSTSDYYFQPVFNDFDKMVIMHDLLLDRKKIQSRKGRYKGNRNEVSSIECLKYKFDQETSFKIQTKSKGNRPLSSLTSKTREETGCLLDKQNIKSISISNNHKNSNNNNQRFQWKNIKFNKKKNSCSSTPVAANCVVLSDTSPIIIF